MRRFFVPPASIHGSFALLDSDEIHHLRDVLRLGAGDEVEIFDGEGRAWVGRIGESGPELRVAELHRVDITTEAPVATTLGLALIKQDRFEWALEKATELGVSEIVPLVTHFCEVEIAPEKVPSRLERWQRILRGAAKQSRRSVVPRLQPPRAWSEFVAGPDSEELRVLFSEQATEGWGDERVATARVTTAIGPEGGWHPSEVDAAVRAGFHVVGLGPRRLRTETAALAALVILQFRFGDMSR